MPGTRCTVAVCGNSCDKTKKAGLNIIYHKFPNNQPYRNIWIKACRRAGKWNPASCHICSIHFTEDDYKAVPRFIRNACSTKRRLKPTAVPSLFLREPPPLQLRSLRPRKKMKISDSDDEGTVPETNAHIDETDSTQQSGNETPESELHLPEISNNIQFEFEIQEETNDLETYDCNNEENNEKLDEAYYEVNEDDKIIENRYSLNDTNFITVRDCSTQTDTDYFLENYRSLVDKTENLENNVTKWNNKCKKLMIHVKYLEAKILNLTVNAAKGHSATSLTK